MVFHRPTSVFRLTVDKSLYVNRKVQDITLKADSRGGVNLVPQPFFDEGFSLEWGITQDRERRSSLSTVLPAVR